MNSQLFHAGDQGLRIDTEDLGCAVWTAYPPVREIQHFQDVSSFQFSQGAMLFLFFCLGLAMKPIADFELMAMTKDDAAFNDIF